jgi:hypothetical protein
MSDPIDRTVYLARSGRPHVAVIAHLEDTRNIPATAMHVFRCLRHGEKDPDTLLLLRAIGEQRDTDPDSPTRGCLKWYREDPAIGDTNASFFACLPLALAYLVHRDDLTAEEQEALREVFAAVAPWFRHMADSPSLFYPNKCLGDVAMLLATGHILAEETIIAEARDFAARWLDYVDRRGMGWGEDHSPVYASVIVEMSLLIMLLEGEGPLHDRVCRVVDDLMQWVADNEGLDAVPSIRGYNFEAATEVKWPLRALLEGGELPDPASALGVLAEATGYRSQARPAARPHQWRRRTFDEHYSTSYYTAAARLGTLSHYPLMPNGYMHDDWGLGWQTKPVSFMVPGQDYGILEWETEDAAGEVRQHEASQWGGFSSRHLFTRLSFHPDVVTVCHQEGPAAIILREIHRLHSPTVRLEDRWRLAPGHGRILLPGEQVWDGKPRSVPGDWLVLDYGTAAVALRPLQCRVLDVPRHDPNPQRRSAGEVVTLRPRLARHERGVYLTLPLLSGVTETVIQPLLYTGWAVVLLDRPEDVMGLSITESLHDDGELPRPYGELLRTVELSTPAVSLALQRDMLTGVTRRYIDDREFVFQQEAKA